MTISYRLKYIALGCVFGLLLSVIVNVKNGKSITMQVLIPKKALQTIGYIYIVFPSDVQLNEVFTEPLLWHCHLVY